MPLSPQDKYQQGLGLGAAVTDPFSRAIQLIAARRFAELDRQRESDEAREMTARSFELGGDQAGADRIRGFAGAFPPDLAPVLIGRFDAKQKFDDAIRQLREESALRSNEASARFEYESAFEAEQNRLSRETELERARISAAGDGAASTGPGSKEWEIGRNRALTALNQFRGTVEATAHDMSPLLHRALGGTTKRVGDRNEPIPIGFAELSATLGPIVSQPGSIRSGMFDDLLQRAFDRAGIKDGTERGRVKAEARQLVGPMRRYAQMQQEFNLLYGSGAGGLGFEPAEAPGGAQAPTPSLTEMATPPIASTPSFPLAIPGLMPGEALTPSQILAARGQQLTPFTLPSLGVPVPGGSRPSELYPSVFGRR